jgi:hypothetical protein
MTEPLLDVRLFPHRLRAGTLTREAIQKHLDALPDDAAHAEETHTRPVSTQPGRRGPKR